MLLTYFFGRAKEANLFPALELPEDMQSIVLGYLPLADLARLACLSKELRMAYVERVTKRDTAVAALIDTHFTAKFREGLSLAQTALPNDLVMHPQVGQSGLTTFYMVAELLLNSNRV
jgi:hypothetical protein